MSPPSSKEMRTTASGLGGHDLVDLSGEVVGLGVVRDVRGDGGALIGQRGVDQTAERVAVVVGAGHDDDRLGTVGDDPVGDDRRHGLVRRDGPEVVVGVRPGR